MVLSGVQRVLSRVKAPQPRLPITPPILRQLRSVWSREVHNYDHILIWAVCCVSFFGFFRLGELIPSSVSAFDPAMHMLLADVAADCPSRPTLISLQLKWAKTDQFGRGATVFLSRSDSDVCPVAALLAYMGVRGQHSGPLFKGSDGAPLAKPWMIGKLREALAEAGHDQRMYAGHSFRNGAATTAAAAGIEDSTIQALGRWSSTAFLSYIRLTPQELALISTRMAATPHQTPSTK